MKNKKKLISLIILLVTMIIVALGALYFFTDMFKNEQQLFYKYISKVNIVDPDFIEKFNEVNKKVTVNNSTSKNKIDFEMKMLNSTSVTNNTQKIFSVENNAKKNLSSKQDYSDFKISVNNKEFLNLEYLRENNMYALNVDKIFDKYLAVENSNLKELFSKFGVKDTSNIPDSIPTNQEEIVKIDEKTLMTLKETYRNLIYNNITKECFYKVVNENKTVTIGLSLSEQEIIDLLKTVLETVKQDEALLNLIINSNYINTTKENFQTEIQNTIDKIAQNTYSADKDFLKIQLIKNNQNVLKLSLETNQTEQANYPAGFSTIKTPEPVKVKYNMEFDFSESNKVNISIKKNEVQINTILFSYNYNEEKLSFNVESNNYLETNGLPGESDISVKLQYQISNYKTDNIKRNCTIEILPSGEAVYQLNVVNDITLNDDILIEKITSENSVKLNDMTSEELDKISAKVINKLIELYGDFFIAYNDRILEHTENAIQGYEQAIEDDTDEINKLNDVLNSY